MGFSGPFILQWPIQILLILSWFKMGYNQDKITMICMESLKHELANISSPNGNKMLIFGKYTFFIKYFQIISANPIILKIYFLWRHHLSTLFSVTIHYYM